MLQRARRFAGEESLECCCCCLWNVLLDLPLPLQERCGRGYGWLGGRRARAKSLWQSAEVGHRRLDRRSVVGPGWARYESAAARERCDRESVGCKLCAWRCARFDGGITGGISFVVSPQTGRQRRAVLDRAGWCDVCDGDWCNVLKKKNGQLVGGGIDIGVVVCE